MKKRELIKMILDLPDDAEIVVHGATCDIMGDYSYNDEFCIQAETAYKTPKGSYNMSISNYVNKSTDKKVTVFCIN